MTRHTKIIAALLTVVLISAACFWCSEFCYAEDSELPSITLTDGTVLTYRIENNRSVWLTGVQLGTGIRTLVLPDEIEGRKLKVISDGAFQGCGKLRALTIPASVTKIGSAVFDGCTSMERFTVAEGNPAFLDDDGVLYSYGASSEGDRYYKLIGYPQQKTDVSYTPLFGTRSIHSQRAPLRSNYLERLDMPPNDHLNTYNTVWADRSSAPNLKEIVFYGKNCRIGYPNGDSEINFPTIVLGGGKALDQFEEKTAAIRSEAGSEAETWAAEHSYSFESLQACPVTIQNKYVPEYASSSFTMNVSCERPVEYASSDSSVAEIDEHGKVTLKKAGVVRLFAFTRYDGHHLPCYAEMTLYVSNPEPKANPEPQTKDDDFPVKVSKQYQNLNVLSYPKKAVLGSTIQLKATAKTQITYQRLKTKCATVTADGKVTFRHPGSVIIRVKAAQSSKYYRTSEKIRIKCVLGKPKLKVKTSRSHAARITWSKVKGAQKYLLYVKMPGSKKYQLAVKRPAKVKSVKHRNLKHGKKYSYKVRAYVKYNGKKYYGPFSKAVTVKAQ